MLVGILRSSCLHNMGWRGQWKMDLVLGGKGIIEEKGVVKREGEMIVLSQFFLSWDKKTHKA